MLNFFKKKPEQSKKLIVATESVLETVPNTKNYPKEVLEIHHEFSIAAETLLSTAKSIIDEASTKDVSKVNRLEKLGFKQAEQVSELKPLIQKAELSKEQIELVKYYQREYPLNKFITEEQVKAICYKWNLVCGEVSRFKGFVPEKNLRDIEKFNLKQQDNVLCFLETRSGEVFFLSKEMFTEHGYHYCVEKGNEFYLVGANGRDVYSDLFAPNALTPYQNREYIYLKHSPKEATLQICAPIKDMDISGLELEDGYKLIKKHVPDPVVLQPVKGGYLIISCWGDEASDPICVNEKFN